MTLRIADPGSLWRLGVALWRKSLDDRLNGLAAEMAFFATFSVFPTLMVVTGLLGWLGNLGGQAVADRTKAVMLDYLGRLFTDRAGGMVVALRGVFESHHRGVVGSALLVALLAMSRGFATAIRALDRAYGLRERRSWIDVRVTALLLAVGSALMVVVALAMLAVGPFLGRGRQLAGDLGLGPIFTFAWDWLRIPVTLALLVIWQSVFYRFGPSHDARWRQGLPGAIGASLAWVIVSYGFGAYIRSVVRFNPIFGVLGGGLILMIFVYVQSAALLLGGELNALLLERSRASDEVGARASS